MRKPSTRVLLAATLALLATAPAAAQKPSLTHYGNIHCLMFGAHGVPALGGTYRINLYTGWRSRTHAAHGLLLTGLSDRRIGAVPLPLRLDRLQPNWCGELLQSAEHQALLPYGVGLLTIRIDVPKDPRLVGLRLFHQAIRVIVDNRGGVEVRASVGAAVVIGT